MVLLCARMRVIMKQKLKLHVRKPFVVVLLTVLVAALVGLQAAYDWHTYRHRFESFPATLGGQSRSRPRDHRDGLFPAPSAAHRSRRVALASQAANDSASRLRTVPCPARGDGSSRPGRAPVRFGLVWLRSGVSVFMFWTSGFDDQAAGERGKANGLISSMAASRCCPYLIGRLKAPLQ